jgi:3-deoxy-D-manno-octulosonate 8-phosphate phosphatase (KDO 8-P phosphatase)
VNEDQLRERALKVTTVIFDVDGVLTDGGIILDSSGAETKRFNVQDGSGLKYLRRSGYELAIISGRESSAVAARAANLGIEHVYQGAKRKIKAYEDLKRKLGVSDEQVAYVGDDLPDVPVMRQCALAVAVANARPEVRAVAHYVTSVGGGGGAAREAAEWLLKLSGKWPSILERYFPEGAQPGE